jgi:hypothetical protein
MAKPHIPWFQVDKSTLTDPRLLAAARELSKRYSVSEIDDNGSRADELPYVTQLSHVTNALRGALMMLWAYAHDNIMPGDELPLDPVSIDAMVGIEGFCDVMPPEWLEISADRQTVKLPHFIDKNQIVKMRQTRENAARRQREKRERERHTDVTRDKAVTSRERHTNVTPLRIENRDKEKPPIGGTKKVAASRLPTPWNLPAEWRQWAMGKGLTQAEADEQGERFSDWWHAAPDPDGRKLDWYATWRTWIRRTLDDAKKGRSAAPRAWTGRPTQESALAAIEAASRLTDVEHGESTYVIGNDEPITYDN